MPTVSACIICYQNENILGECLESIKGYVDEIIVVDSYSKDKTRQVASGYTDKVYDFEDPSGYWVDNQELFDKLGLKGEPTNQRFLADYAAVRNFSFSKATSDYIIWLDSDDIVKNPEEIRNIVSDMDNNKSLAVRINYDYAYDKYGKPAMSFFRERIIKNDPKIKWIYPAHEVLDIPGTVDSTNKPLNIEHRNHHGGNVARKIKNKGFKILKSWVLSNNEQVDPRILFYLGNEARGVSVDEEIDAYEKYLKVGWWDEELALARATMGCIFENLGDYNKAWNYYAGSLMTCDKNPDGYFGLARIAYYKGMWDKCVKFTSLGLENPFRGQLWQIGPSFGFNNPYVYSNLALFKVGQVSRAFSACVNGLEIEPDNKNLINNKEIYVKQLEGRQDGI